MKKEETFILIDEINIRNFKGVANAHFRLDGLPYNVYGPNASCKTTIFLTGFTWLLTGKDELDRTDYEIKNTNRPELNRLSHEVEFILRVNSKRVTLKRVFLESWVKPKGSSKEEFKGHKTEFYCNDVQCGTAAEYKQKVEAIIPGNILKMITNPLFFNSLDWKDQRRGLIGIAGPVTDDQIFESIVTDENDFADLKRILASGDIKNVEEQKGVINAQILKLKKAAVEYAPRIDEAKLNKPQVQDWKAIEKEIADKSAEIERLDGIISDAVKALSEKHKEINDGQNRVFKKQNTLKDIRNKIRTKLETERAEGPNKITALKQQIGNINNSITSVQADIANKNKNLITYQNEIVRLDKIIDDHRAVWMKINGEKFEFDDEKCECPTCKQKLPEDKISEKRAELLKNFNESVASRKAEEVKKSDQRKLERKQQEESIAATTEAIEILQGQLESHQRRLAEINEKLEALVKEAAGKTLVNIGVATDALLKLNDEALNLQDEITEFEKQIKIDTEALNEDKENDQSANKDKKKIVQLEIDQLRSKLGLKKTIEDTDRRIEQLEREEQATAQEIARLQKQEFDIDAYTRAQMDIIQERVNSMFRFVNFRLFEKQVNGQIVESCVCEMKGVPYPTLNTAAKLQAGLDVLETFSNHYGIHAPVICDNRESVGWIPESKSQIINLRFLIEEKELRIEPAEEMMATA